MKTNPYQLNELYYPAADSQLHVEVGTLDGVPDECYLDAPDGEGLRELQARDFEQQNEYKPNRFAISSTHSSRWTT